MVLSLSTFPSSDFCSFFKRHLWIALLVLITAQSAMALTPDCPIVSGKVNMPDGSTADPSATGWTSDGSAVSNALYFAAKSNRFHAENLGGVGIWRSNVFSVAGYPDFQIATKISSEGDMNSSEYVRVYYKLNGGSEVLMAEQTGNFGTLDLKSAVLTGNTIQFVIRIYNYDNGGSQTSKYYVEDYRVFREHGPCSGTGGTISVSASASNPILTCSTSSTTLTASSSASGVTYSWTGPGTISNPNSASITVSTAGTYTVTGTSAAGSGSASVTVTENKTAPDLSATGGTLACGTSVVLNASASVSGATYRWTGPGSFTSTTRTPTVSTAGDYTVTVTNPSNGCTASRTVSVTSGTSTSSAFWLEDFTGLSNGATSDTGATAWTSSTGGAGTFSVQNSKFMGAFNAGNTSEGIWTSASIDISTKSNVVVTVDLESGTGSTNDAFEDSDYINVFYKLNGGAETQFFGDINGLNGTTTGSAAAVATSPALNGSTLQIVIRLKNTDPTERYYFDNIKFAGTSSALTITTSVSGVVTCSNSAQIFATPPSGTTVSSYAWTGPNSFTSSSQNPTVTAGGQYQLTATLSGGCTVQVPVNVTENKTAPDLSASGGSLACATSFTLNANSTVANATYSWTGPNSFTSTVKNPAVTAAGTYTVTVRNPANGCTTAQSVQVTAAPTGTIWLEDFTGLADGTTSDTGTTSWSRTTTGGTYAVSGGRFVNTNMTSSNTTSVGVWTSAAIPVSGMTNVSFTVDVWSSVTGSAVMNGAGSAADVLDYLRVYYKLNGGAEVLVSEKPGAINNHSTTATVISSAALTGSTLQIIIKGRATGPDEFYYFDNVKVTAVTASTVNATASVSGPITCTTTSVALSGNSTTSGVSYSWTGPNGFTSTSQNPTVSVAGTYNLTVSTPAGCTGVASVTVVEDKTTPTATASVSGSLSCTTTSVTLQGGSNTSGVTYRWTGPNSFTSSSQNPGVTAGGTYTLTVSAASGCTGTATVNVVENKTAPSATASVNGTLSCATTSVTLQGSSTTTGVTYAWSGPGGFSSTTQNPVVSTPGTYILTVMNPANGCMSASQSVTVPAAGTATVLWLEDFTGLPNGTTSDTGTTAWSRTTTNGTYAVADGRFVNTNLTTANASSVGVWTSAAIPVSGLTNVSFTLDVWSSITGSGVMNGTGAATDVLDYLRVYYKLNGGAEVLASEKLGAINNHSTTAMVISLAGLSGSTLQIIIKARATGEDEFYYFDNVKVSGATTTSVNATAGVSGPITCTNTSVTLSGSSSASGVTYSWTGPGGFTSTAQNPSVSVAGQYTLTVSNGGCMGTATVTVVEDKSLPGATATKSGSITCSTSTVTLTAAPTATGITASYSWTASEGGGTITNPNTATPTVSTAGTYTVVVRNTVNGCTSSASVSVSQNNTVPANVTATASGNITCVLSSVTLTATSSTAGVTYSWAGGPGTGTITNPNTATPTVSTPGTYIAVVTNTANGCSVGASVTVSQDNTIPANVTATASGNITCLQPSVTLTATSSTTGVTYSWTGGQGTGTITNPNTATPTVSTAGIYMVTARNSTNGCSTTKSVTVTEDKVLPTVSAGSSGTFTCVVNSVTLTATTSTANATYQWSGPGGFTSTVRNPAVSVSGTYNVTARNPVNGCTSLAASVTTTENKTLPGVTASAGNLTCSVLSVTLNGNSATSGVIYSWTGPSGYTSAEKNPVTTVPGNYTLTVSNPANGCTSSTTVSVAQDNAAPAGVTATASGPKTCSQGLVTLHGNSTTSNVSYSWTGPFGFTSTQQHASALNAGLYQLRVTNLSSGCYTLTSVMVVEDITSPENVAAAASGDLSCRNTTVTLTATSTSPSVDYSWSGPNGFNASTQSVNISEAGDYMVIIEVPDNECAAELLMVTVLEDRTMPEAVAATGGVLSCASPSVTLGGSSTTAGVSYKWTSPNGFLSTEQNPTVNVPGVYTLTVTHDGSGCTRTATATVGEADTSIPGGVTISGPGVVTCVTASAQLTASASGTGVTYHWTGPVAIANPNVATIDISVAGTYTVTASVPGSGCSATASKTVTVNNTPPSVTATADKITCVTSVARLMASSTTSGVIYSWTGPGTITNPTSATASTSTPGTYTVTITNPANSCTATATVNVEANTTVPNAGTVSSNAGFILTCYTNSITLSITSTTAGATFTWMNSSGTVIGTSPSQVVTTPDTYLVMVTNPANGCTLSRTRAVTQNLVSPTASINSSGSVSCRTPSVTLTGTSSGSPVTFTWSGTNTVTPISTGTTTATASVSAAGTYTLTLRTPGGCTATASTTVAGNTTPPANVTASADGALSCTNIFVTLTGSSSTAGVTYAWTGPDGFTSTERETVTTVPGQYTLTVANSANGCTVVQTVIVGGQACTDF